MLFLLYSRLFEYLHRVDLATLIFANILFFALLATAVHWTNLLLILSC